MAELIAQGPEAQQRWRRTLPDEESVILGRGNGAWGVEWDNQISRQHVQLTVASGRLRVDRVLSATNPVFFNGRQLNEFHVSPGEHFVIGKSRFTFVVERPKVTMDFPLPDSQRKFSSGNLRRLEYRDASRRIAFLSQLPDVISRSANEHDLNVNLVNLLLAGIRKANAAAIVQLPDLADDGSHVKILHWDQRLVSELPFVPSGKLIKGAVESGETVLHAWTTGTAGDPASATVVHEGDWAIAIPLTGPDSTGLAIYVAGNHSLSTPGVAESDPFDLRDDIKFTELIATTLSNLRHTRRLERSQAGLRSFFSPVVLDALTSSAPENVLAPRECEVSVMFCDLRGFTLKSEQAANNLMGLLDRVSSALGVTTNEILQQRGVVGDFHGDAAMGFWGWPLEQPDRAERACAAAIEIQNRFAGFAREPGHALNDFQVGVGIATGKAVAGRIGTSDQVKVTVFGPVVNLAARLESLNQQLRTGILVDGRTDQLLRDASRAGRNLPFRVRRLAVIQPYGMEAAIAVSQILPLFGPSCGLTDEDLVRYETALDAFTDGRWQESFELLHGVPAEDTAKDFLTVFIAQHKRNAPSDWRGVIAMRQK